VFFEKVFSSNFENNLEYIGIKYLLLFILQLRNHELTKETINKAKQNKTKQNKKSRFGGQTFKELPLLKYAFCICYCY